MSKDLTADPSSLTANQADRFNVYGTDPSNNYTFNGGDGADTFYMQTDPASRNNISLNGQAGNDTLYAAHGEDRRITGGRGGVPIHVVIAGEG